MKKGRDSAGRASLEGCPETNLIFYRLGKLLLIIGLIALPMYRFGFSEALEPYNYCVFKKTVGLYCPGCGGTRALKALLSGHPLLSLYAHPAVLYFAVFYVVFMLRMFFFLHFGGSCLKGEDPDGDGWDKRPEVLPESERPAGKGILRYISRPVSEKRVVWGILFGIILIFAQWIFKNALLIFLHYTWIL